MEFIRAVYNPTGPDGMRRVRQAVFSVGRRNGKTLLMAIMLLAHLCGPARKQNSILLSAANTRQQASIVFQFVSDMIRANPVLQKMVKVIASTKRMVNPKSNSTYIAISADATTNLGLGPDFVVYDEFGNSKNRTLYDVLMTSLGSQAEPLMCIISTQAPSDEHPLSELIDYGQKIKDGIIEDDTFVSHVYTAPADCELLDESAWMAANPGLGDYRDLDEFRSTIQRAMQVPSLESSVRNLYLNQRVQADSPFLTPSVWDRNKETVNRDIFRDGRPVFGGLDLSSRTDLTALVLATRDDEGIVHLMPYCWTPEDGLLDRANRDRAPYDAWLKGNRLRTTPGPTIDYDFVASDIAKIIEGMWIDKIFFDRWRIDIFRSACERVGLSVELAPHGQGFKDMSPVIEAFEAAAIEGRLRHESHPVLRWAISNCVVLQDPAGNRKLDKAKSYGRIDPAIAAIMATRGLLCEEQLDGFAGRGELLLI
jgi:phage terminase large subunit-like protein